MEFFRNTIIQEDEKNEEVEDKLPESADNTLFMNLLENWN
jgi:hypothetical protein